MIKIETRGIETEISFEGNKVILMSEVTLILRRMKEKGIVDEKEIDMICKTAKESKEEIEKRAKESVERILKEVLGCFDKEEQEQKKGNKSSVTVDDIAEKIADIFMKKLEGEEKENEQ